VAITVNGIAYGWGRNETGQLGLGEISSVVPVPTILSAGEGEDGGDLKFVGAGVGKYHTILVGDDGRAYASGGNPCGQLGINNAGTRGIDRFRRCVVAGAGGGGGQIDGDGGEDDGGVKIVQVSGV
jgi:alpha-tubulin suppressor-like RCC1 family protein